MDNEPFTVKVERHGIDYHIIIENSSGRRWMRIDGETYPDNLGEYAIELEHFLNSGGKVDREEYKEMPRMNALSL